MTVSTDPNACWSCHRRASAPSLPVVRTLGSVSRAVRSTHRYACATPGSNSAAGAPNNLGGPSIALMASTDATIIISGNQVVINYHRLPALGAGAATRGSRSILTRESTVTQACYCMLTCESIYVIQLMEPNASQSHTQWLGVHSSCAVCQIAQLGKCQERGAESLHSDATASCGHRYRY